MLYQSLVLLFCVHLNFGLEQMTIKFAIEYFECRNVKSICELTCEEHNLWSYKFAKAASHSSIAVSRAKIDGLHDHRQVDKCLEVQTSTGVIIDHKCSMIQDILYYASQNMLLDSTHKWLIIVDEDNNLITSNNSNQSNNNNESNDTNESNDINESNDVNASNDTNTTTITDASIDGNTTIDIDASNDINISNDINTSNDTNATTNIDASIDSHNTNDINANENIDASDDTIHDINAGNNILLNKNKQLSRMYDIFNNLNISVDADIIISLQKGPLEYNLYDVFNFGKVQGGNLIMNNLGTWDNNKGAESNLNSYKYYRRWDFQQSTVRMIVVMLNPPVPFDPELITSRQPTPGVALITKTSSMVLQEVANIHNFRYTYTITDRWIASFDKNSSKVVATSLYYKDHDISPIIRLNEDVHEKIDIVHPPLTSIETRYYYRIPTHGAGKFENQFLRPLTTAAWGCVAAVLALCSLALLATAALEQRPSTAQYAFFSVIATFCQQFFEDCGDHASRRTSSARKLTVLVSGASCLLIYNYYTSSVVSWLLNGPPPTITSLRELLESPLLYIYEDQGYTRSWLQTPTYYYNKRNAREEDEMRQKVFSKRKDEPLLVPLEKGVQMVKDGGYAYHTEVQSANALISRKFTQRELCELGSLQSMERTPLYPAVQKRSPYKEFLVWSLARLSERGIVSCIQRRTGSPPVACEGSSPRALALGGAAPAFVLLAGGYLLATLILVLEKYVSKLHT